MNGLENGGIWINFMLGRFPDAGPLSKVNILAPKAPGSLGFAPVGRAHPCLADLGESDIQVAIH